MPRYVVHGWHFSRGYVYLNANNLEEAKNIARGNIWRFMPMITKLEGGGR